MGRAGMYSVQTFVHACTRVRVRVLACSTTSDTCMRARREMFYLGVSGHFPFHANPLSFHTAIIMSRPVKRVSAMRCATGRRKGTDKQALDREEYSSIAKENISPVT